MSERLSSERAVRLLRAKAAELENEAKLLLGDDSGPMIGLLAADIALIATLLADHIERSERHDEQLRRVYEYLADRVIPAEVRERLSEPLAIDDANLREYNESRENAWRISAPGPGQPGDASDAT